MTAFQMVVIFGMEALAAGLGLYCLVLFFRRARDQVVIAFHLLAGLGAIELLIGIIHMSDLDADSPVRALGMTAVKLFGVAAASGALTPFVGKGRRQLANLLLTIHVGTALFGVVTTLMFVRQI
jgi:hypothetical protein